MSLFTLLADEATWYPVLFDSPMNAVRGVCFWLSIALALTFVLCALLIKGEGRKKFFRISLAVVLPYACLVGATLLLLTFLEDGIKLILFVPVLILLLVIGADAVVLSKIRTKAVLVATGCAVGGALVAVLVCMGVHFASGNAANDNWLQNEDVNSLGLYLAAVLAIAAVVAVAFLCGRKDKKGFDSKTISYAAICIAMSFALSYLRIVKMPQGGSITIASLLPLMIYSYMFGTKKGVFAGAIYSVLQALQDMYILHPAQFILDYPAAFACIGLAGMFAKEKKLEKLPQLQFALGGIIAGLARFLMHFLSGIFAFGAFAPEGQPVWLYSLGYQAGYVLPDIAIAIVVGVFVFSSKAFVKQSKRFHTSEGKPLQEETVS